MPWCLYRGGVIVSTVNAADLKGFGNNVNQSMYLHHWILQAIKDVAGHWFWAKPNQNETIKLILLWQLLPDFPSLPSVRLLPPALKERFVAAAREAGDYPVEIDDYERGEKINRNAYIPVELKRAIFVMADQAKCSMSYVINAALRSYLVSGAVPGFSAQLRALQPYRASLERVKSMVISSQHTDSAEFSHATEGEASPDSTGGDNAFSPALDQKQSLERAFLQSCTASVNSQAKQAGVDQTPYLKRRRS